MSENAKANLWIAGTVALAAICAHFVVFETKWVMDIIFSHYAALVVFSVGIVLILMSLFYNEEYYNLKMVLFYAGAYSVIFSVIMIVMNPIGSMQIRKDEALGCYPVTREYEECGPVEGKPGFTKCVKKTEKVCPEEK